MLFAGFDQFFIDNATHRRRVIRMTKRKFVEISSSSTTNPPLSSICTTMNTTPVSVLTQESATSEITNIFTVNEFLPAKKKQRRKTTVRRLQDERDKLEDR